MLLGTFWVWLILGLSEFDDDVPDWISPTAVALGLLTAALTLLVAVAAFRRRPREWLAKLAAGLQLVLAVCTAVALGSVLGTAILAAGAVLLWTAGRVHPAS